MGRTDGKREGEGTYVVESLGEGVPCKDELEVADVFEEVRDMLLLRQRWLLHRGREGGGL